jgi:hypothetical protein
MTDYHIEKSRRRVTITTRTGDVIPGDMFLQPYARWGGQAERPIDILNAAESFFPLRRDDGEVVLVAKNQVATVACDGTDEEEGTGAAITRRASVEVRLLTGETVSATVLLEVPEDHSRLLDFLNLWKPRFLPLDTVDGKLLVNRGMIERVRALD